jgi:hypothetical protein
MRKMIVSCILIMGMLIPTLTCFADNSLNRTKILSEARKLFAEKSYQKCIDILEATFAEEKLTHSWVVDDVVINARNLLGECYLKTKQYYRAYDTFNTTADYTMHDEYSFYRNDAF